MNGFVLKGHICHSLTPTEISVTASGYVVCEDGVSRGVFAALPPQYRGLPLYDYGDRLILPGLVDLHVHAPQYAYRGTGMDLQLMHWLETYAFPEESKYTDLTYADAAYRIFAEDLRRGATTRACIFATCHRPATELLMDRMEETGLVTFVGKVNMDQDAPDCLREESADASARETLAWLEDTAGRYTRTKPILTPRFIPSCSRPLLDRLGEIQRSCRLPVQSHLSESQGEVDCVRKLFPDAAFYGDAYERFGLFGRNGGVPYKAVMAHCVLSSPEEVALMKRNGVFVAHCPASNTNLSSGIAPIRRYLSQGLNVGLGSDVAGGFSTSMFRAMTDAIQVSKLRWVLADPQLSPLSFPEAFYLATRGGGAFFGKVGSFEEGFAFDALVLDDSALPHPQPLTLPQRLERLAYLAPELPGIHAKYAAGRCLFSGGTGCGA